MVVGLKLLMALALSLVPWVSSAQQVNPSLVEGWQSTLEQHAAPIPWSHAFALRRDEAARPAQARQRLIEELQTLNISARAAGQPAVAEGLARWQATLRELDDERTRTPGRFDLPWLGANLRQVPPLSAIAHWGFCTVPDWVEVWSLDGVRRVPWSAELQLVDVYRDLSSTARQADHAALIVPSGKVLRRGVAAWNRQATPLAPGSRVVFELPNRQGLQGALPFNTSAAFPGTRIESDLVNRRLPALLATRLPGDDCALWHAN
ncbi:capsule biosynthesis GfcC family protein [Halomonas korlensis]|uniref:Capsule biosynthesis GfcC n=1 Tax=Halomonas korlensis TaxID=463301 RepID=A0A1I7KD89_9GAMM|nr:capsule biosynthesis GfcC family protein [Halomonas korlensis]SFU95379.1 Capsule biosynthesis GfcC [Halomonas korlensis]